MQRGQIVALGANMAHKPHVVRRIDRIIVLGGRVSPRISRLAGTVVVVFLGVCATALGTSTLHATPEPQGPDKAAQSEPVIDFKAQLEEIRAFHRQQFEKRRLELRDSLEAFKSKGNSKAKVQRVEKRLLALKDELEELNTWSSYWNKSGDWDVFTIDERRALARTFHRLAGPASAKGFLDQTVYGEEDSTATPQHEVPPLPITINYVKLWSGEYEGEADVYLIKENRWLHNRPFRLYISDRVI